MFALSYRLFVLSHAAFTCPQDRLHDVLLEFHAVMADLEPDHVRIGVTASTLSRVMAVLLDLGEPLAAVCMFSDVASWRVRPDLTCMQMLLRSLAQMRCWDTAVEVLMLADDGDLADLQSAAIVAEALQAAICDQDSDTADAHMQARLQCALQQVRRNPLESAESSRCNDAFAS
jgi:hypothetical protein